MPAQPAGLHKTQAKPRPGPRQHLLHDRGNLQAFFCGIMQSTASGERFTIVQPLPSSASFAYRASAMERSICSAYPSHPAAARLRKAQPHELPRPLSAGHIRVYALDMRRHVARRNIEGRGQHGCVAGKKNAAAHGGRQPFMRIDGDRVRALDPGNRGRMRSEASAAPPQAAST